MKYSPKDILRIELPHISGDPIVEITFLLYSNSIELILLSERVYNTENAEILSQKCGLTKLKCKNDSKIYLFSNFNILQNIYYYPFTSSTFLIDYLKIQTENIPRLEISIPEEYKSLTFLSFVHNIKSNTEHKEHKENETWSNKKGIFYFPLFMRSSFKFTMRATGRSINYGIIHIILPIIIFLIGLLFNYGNLPKSVTENAPSILIGILLALTPFYVGILQDFISKSFMSINLGMYLYLKSYLLAVIYIVLFILCPSLTMYLIAYSVLWILLFLYSIKNYFRKGKFDLFTDTILYRPILFFIINSYKISWKRQIKMASNSTSL